MSGRALDERLGSTSKKSPGSSVNLRSANGLRLTLRRA